jgi:hypothetical protein
VSSSPLRPLEAEALIARLGLRPHPEGGHYVETYRHQALGADGAPVRGACTAIYFLLARGEESGWHRVDADELWHFYAGAPLELRTAAPGGPRDRRVLGPDVSRGQRPQLLVPAGQWQAARSLGDYTLVGATVSPAFEFSGFELAPLGFEPG